MGEVTGISIINKNGFYNPVTTDGTIVVDGIIASTYASLNGGSYFEVAGLKFMSFQSFIDMTMIPYRSFCTLVSYEACNKLVGIQNDKSTVVNFMTEFYKFWSQQKNVVQFIVFLAFVLLFGMAYVMLNPVGMLGCVLGGLIWMYYCKPTRKKSEKQVAV